MNRHLKMLIYSLSIILLIVGCAREVAVPVREGYLTAKEKEWLAKAYRVDRNGWTYLHIEGEPYERGFQRGFLTANEIDEFLKTTAYLLEFQTAKELDFFVEAAAKLFKKKVSREYVEEMKGMVAGMQRAGKKVTYEEMLFMNGFIDIWWYWWPKEKESIQGGCSAFIATGEATADGKIVMGHNSWASYALLRFCNIIVDIVPDKGHRILMQSWGPCIYSATDFFITSAGLIGTETTIGGFRGFNRKGTPVFERARRAMQYANSIDEWARIMIKNNNGAYANSWLLGDIKTSEIARLELGLKHHSLEKKTTGYISGSNITDNIKILREETKASYDDIRDRRVSRRERWKQLMKKHHGKIDVEIAKQLLADHYDVYLEKEKPSSRTICGHHELDDGSIPASRGAYYPGGAIDGKVVDTDMAKNWQFWAKWGSSCDIGFDAKRFLEKHTQYDWLQGYLRDLPAGPWTIFPVEEKE
ncbi:MAG: C45 family autoproteolytic acyltransferase/hydrolase [Planctomycetota bacterium]